MTQVQLRCIITIFSCSLASPHVLGLLRIPSRTIEYHRTPCIGCHTLAQEVTNEKCPSCIIRAGDSKDGCCVKLYLMMPWCGWCRRWCWWCCRWRWLQKGMMAGKGVKDDNCKAWCRASSSESGPNTINSTQYLCAMCSPAAMCINIAHRKQFKINCKTDSLM